MMRYRPFLTVASVLALASLLFSAPALANLEVNYDFSWNDDFDRCQGSGYNINIDITNQYPNQIQITRVGVHLDWQSPGEYHDDYQHSGWMGTGDGHWTSIFIPIPQDAYVGDHSYDILVEFEVQDGNGTYTDSMQIFDWNFYVESSRYPEAQTKRGEAINAIDELNTWKFESQEANDRAQQAHDAFNNAENFFNAQDYDNAITEYDNAITWASEAIDIEQGHDPGGNGNGDGGWSFDASVDWDSIGTGVSSGGFMMLIVITLISTLVAMPLIYYFSKTW